MNQFLQDGIQVYVAKIHSMLDFYDEGGICDEALLYIADLQKTKFFSSLSSKN